MFRAVVSAVIILLGLSALLYGAAFVQGPLVYWSDPFQSEAVKSQALIVGAASLIIGSISLVFALTKKRGTRHAA